MRRAATISIVAAAHSSDAATDSADATLVISLPSAGVCPALMHRRLGYSADELPLLWLIAQYLGDDMAGSRDAACSPSIEPTRRPGLVEDPICQMSDPVFVGTNTSWGEAPNDEIALLLVRGVVLVDH